MQTMNFYLEAIKLKGYGLAKLVFGTSVAGYISDELEEKYGRKLDVEEFCHLVYLTFHFELCQLNDIVSQWVCRFINGQEGLEEVPVELRTTNFQFWKSIHLSKDEFKYQGKKDSLYSVGCFLENVATG